jgi:molybdopterin converting factor small subunit
VRYFAGARAASGIAEETVTLPIPNAAALIELLRGRHGDAFAKVLPACSFLLDGVAVRDHHAEIPDGAEFDVLPPFAGG